MPLPGKGCLLYAFVTALLRFVDHLPPSAAVDGSGDNVLMLYESARYVEWVIREGLIFAALEPDL
jgi:hypothetical protein